MGTFLARTFEVLSLASPSWLLGLICSQSLIFSGFLGWFTSLLCCAITISSASLQTKLFISCSKDWLGSTTLDIALTTLCYCLLSLCDDLLRLLAGATAFLLVRVWRSLLSLDWYIMRAVWLSDTLIPILIIFYQSSINHQQSRIGHNNQCQGSYARTYQKNISLRISFLLLTPDLFQPCTLLVFRWIETRYLFCFRLILYLLILLLGITINCVLLLIDLFQHCFLSGFHVLNLPLQLLDLYALLVLSFLDPLSQSLHLHRHTIRPFLIQPRNLAQLLDCLLHLLQNNLVLGDPLLALPLHLGLLQQAGSVVDL